MLSEKNDEIIRLALAVRRLGGFEKLKGMPEIITLCGSSRFIEQFAIFAWELEKGGAVVLSLHLLPADYAQGVEDHIAEAQGVAAQMDELHLRKIDLADRVIVMNVGGYYGDSTRREIAYAREHDKHVSFLYPEYEQAAPESPGLPASARPGR